MHKALLCLLVSVTFFINEGKCQNSIDKVKAQALFKETISLFSSFLSFQRYNRDSARLLSKVLINKYLKIYQTDTTSSSIGDFLSDCYTYNKEYEKAIYWDRRQLLVNTKSSDKIVYYENLAYSFVCLGKLDSSKFYLAKAYILITETDNSFDILAKFKAFADSLYLLQDKEDLDILHKANKMPCQYSVEILRLILPYLKDNRTFVTKSFNEETIDDREKNCR